MHLCVYCQGICVKCGKQPNGSQKLRCRTCGKHQLSTYRYRACRPGLNEAISGLLTEGVGMRGIARILKISVTTILARIRHMATAITKPPHVLRGAVIEMDELWTFVKRKANEVWLMYAIDRSTRQVVDFRIGSRSKERLRQITDPIVRGPASQLSTDGLTIYKGLIPSGIHSTHARGTVHIERFNLNLRTHLKRLSRKTICFSRSMDLLEAALKIYFWGVKASK